MRRGLPGALPDLGHVRLWLFAAVLLAVIAAVFAGVALAVAAGLAVEAAGYRGPLDERLPRIAVGGVVALPLLFYACSLALQRRSVGRTFYQQATDNRLASATLMLALVGLVVSLGAIIGTVVSFEAEGGLLGAAIGGLVGLLALLVARFAGGSLVVSSVHAQGVGEGDDRRLRPAERQVLDITREVALAAGIPTPRLHIVEDPAINAFAVGHAPSEGRIVVTRGLVEQLDREQQQGVIGHEMAHLRNLDSRYGLYVVVVIGLVALITDGFLRIVIEAWKNGAFLRGAEASEDGRAAVAAFVGGVLFGLLLLAVAGLLRVFAPIFALALQASVSREREFLADATAVELTRNPVGLERALQRIGQGTRSLHAGNRGTQNLWFDNPVKAGSDRRSSLFTTHPSIPARIERLRFLRGEAAVLAGRAADQTAGGEGG